MPIPIKQPSTQEDIASVMDRFEAWNASRQNGPTIPKVAETELSLADFLATRTKQKTEYGYLPATDTPPLKASMFSQVIKTPAPAANSPAADPPPSPSRRTPKTVAQKAAENKKQPRARKPSKTAFPGTESMDPGLASSFKSALETSIRENTPTAPRRVRVATTEKVSHTPDPAAQYAARSSSQSAGEGRNTSLNLRLSAVEQLQIKAGAEEAGLPVSAYVRQCVLEVNTLRERLTLAISELSNAAGAASTLPVRVPPTACMPRPGMLARIRSLWSARAGLTP